MAKLKNIDWKQFFINHGEKLVLGVIALAIVGILATSNWVPFNEKTPDDINKAVSGAKAAMDQLKYKPENAEEFGLAMTESDKPAAMVKRELLDDWSAGRWDLKVPIAGSPSDKRIPLQEPGFDQHPIRNLIAFPGRVLLNLGPDVTPVESTETPSGTAPTPPTGPTAPPVNPLIARGLQFDSDEFTARGNIPAPAPSVAGGTGAGGRGYIPRGRGGSMSMMGGGMMYMTDYMYSELGGGGGSYAGQNLKGRGQPFISVRGIIPLYELIQDVKNAMNLNLAEAAQNFRLIDYVLERQTMNVDGSWPADDQWQEVDRTTAEGILREVAGFDIDPIPAALTDYAVTMPLPLRITGAWGKTTASHPDIDQFTLDAKQIEQEKEYQIKLLRKAQEMNALDVRPEELDLPTGGFASVVDDTRRIQAQILKNRDVYNATSVVEGIYGQSVAQNDALKKLVDELAKGEKGKPDEALKEYITKRLTAVGNVLLFRFIDFAVEPGKSYRYRARLVIENPNRLARVADAADPSVIAGDTRFTAWSNITAPSEVPLETQYFITDVESDKNKVLLDFFYFDPNLGTTVSNLEPDPPEADNKKNRVFKRLEVYFGEPVGGLVDFVWLLNPAKMTFSKDADPATTDVVDKYSFISGDLLVTALPDIHVKRTDHPSLVLPDTQNRDLQMVNVILVSDRNGKLKTVDSVYGSLMRDYLQEYVVEPQNAPFRPLKQTGALLAGACPEGLYMELDMGGDMMGGGRVNRPTKSALKRSAIRKPPVRRPGSCDGLEE